MRFKAMSLVLVLALVAVVAAGCGSKKAASTTEGTSTTTAAAGTTTTAATTSAGTGAPSFASAKNCAQLATMGEKFSQAMAASGSGKATIADAATAYKALADAAPSEIRADFQTIAAAFSDYANALKKANYTPGQVPTASQLAALAAAAKSFSSPKLTTAEQHLTAWSKKNCTG